MRAVAGIVVGADRIAANGDTANKIGTYNLAVLAHHHGVPFYVVAPTRPSTRARRPAHAIPIEQRSADEVRASAASSPRPTARRPQRRVRRHAGRADHAIVTERGVFRPPYDLAGSGRE